MLVVEDFAHHPTAVGVTLAAVRQAYPERRLVAAFEPRTNTSRRRIFQEPYAQAFQDADLILVREPPDLWKVEPEEQFSSRELVADLQAHGKEALYFPDTDALLAGLLHTLRPGDVVLVMSNGDFNHLVPRLCEALGGEPEPLSPCLTGPRFIARPPAPLHPASAARTDYQFIPMWAQWALFVGGSSLPLKAPTGAPPFRRYILDRNPVSDHLPGPYRRGHHPLAPPLRNDYPI